MVGPSYQIHLGVDPTRTLSEENFRMPFASITGGGMLFCSILEAISL